MPMNPACQTFLPRLSPFIDGELSPAERELVERHIGVCKDCAMRVADLRAESGLVRVGLELAADEVDFRDFAQKVMARVTPEQPPLSERLRIWFSETFLYQRRVLVSSFATAAVVLAIAVPLALQSRAPVGYGAERMVVEGVTADPGAVVAPVVYKTDTGDAIIWLVDQPPEEQRAPAAPAESHEPSPADAPDAGQNLPTGGPL